MAVTLTAQQLAYRLRLVADTDTDLAEPQLSVVNAVLSAATALVLEYAPTAPDAIHNEAATRLAGFLYDAPPGASTRFQNAMQQSGAVALLGSYRVRRAAALEDSARSDTRDLDLLDMIQALTARVVELEAGGGAVVAESARLPVDTAIMRLGWAQSQIVDDSYFIRANTHPADGAAVGTVTGLNPPPFPPALNTDLSLYLYIWIAAPIANIGDVRLAGSTILTAVSSAMPYTLEGVAGTLYISNQRLSAGTSAFRVSAVVAGALIASQPWVLQQIADL